MPRKKIPLDEQLRKIIKESHMTRYRISKMTGVDAAVLCKFVAGDVGLSMKSLNALGELFDIRLLSNLKPKRERARK